MKILSLNTWGGRAGKSELLEFFNKHNNQIDIFCLQEIWSAPYEHLEGKVIGGKEAKHQDIMVYGLQEISAILADYVPYFRPHHLDNYGLMMFVHKNIKVYEEGETFVHKEKGFEPVGDVGHHARNVQYVTCGNTNNPITVMNFHGLWNGMGKTDSGDRLLQSSKIISFIKGFGGEIVLGGDFNLLPETESLKMIERSGLRNLIREKGITSTRTSFYTKPDKFADYIFVSNALTVKEFNVLPDEVSDHAALLIEIE